MADYSMLDSSSDYGYDLSAEDEYQLYQKADTPAWIATSDATLRTISTGSPSTSAGSIASVLPAGSVSEESSRLNDAALDPGFAYAHEPRLLVGDAKVPFYTGGKAPAVTDKTSPRNMSAYGTVADDVSYPDLSRALSNLESDTIETTTELVETKSDSPDDTRSPLVRFRSYPRKPFSVSDLTSGAWCELQYYYTLTRLPGGRKTRTPVMREGTNIHKKLEDEVHSTVRVDVASKEEGFALRLWNVIQGLRTLRDTGMTRELEVWGMVDGNLVGGVIDKLSYQNPNEEFEAELSSQEAAEAAAADKQSTITDFYGPKKLGKVNFPGPKIYLTDVKTRGSLKIPNSPAYLRGPKVQLFLYHRFLSEMASDKLDFLRVFRRYGLDPDEPFSDHFIAEIGGLHDEIFYDAESHAGDRASESDGDGGSSKAQSLMGEVGDAFDIPDLVRYRTLRELIPLLTSELHLTFPHAEHSLGSLLEVEFRFRGDGHVIDTKVFPVENKLLDSYLAIDMEWWKGEREPRGVQLQEAFKCGFCEFAENCSWRINMDEKRLRKAREKMGTSE